MKIIFNRNTLLVLLTMFWFACEEDRDIEYSEGSAINQKVADPYLQINTSVIGFQAGTEDYEYDINVINPSNDLQLKEIKMYSVFTDAETGAQSNEVVLATVPVEGVDRNELIGTLDYDQLKAGVTVNGAGLPDDQTDLKVGSGWKVRFEGVTQSGKTVRLKGNMNVAVLSRFAGIYKVIASEYYRIGVFTADWNGQERFIGSVDEDTFSYNDWWGNFAWTGNQFNFDINFDDNSIRVPIPVDGLFSGNRALDCSVEPQTFTKVSCAGSNVLIPDDATGKHIIKITYGYYTDGSGAREFQETLEKVVD